VDRAQFYRQMTGCLSHHNEIAEDSHPDANGNIPSGHRLFTNPKEYTTQFQLRIHTALKHIQQMCQEMSNPSLGSNRKFS